MFEEVSIYKIYFINVILGLIDPILNYQPNLPEYIVPVVIQKPFHAIEGLIKFQQSSISKKVVGSVMAESK